jgi:hypothetical protein
MTSRNFNLNEDFYSGALQAVGSLSKLYSENSVPFFQYRFIENLFVKATGGENISRKDTVFDAIVGENSKIAVGVKTFTLPKQGKYKLEKVQEFTSLAGRTNISRLSDKDLIIVVCQERNRRIRTESANFNIDPSKSIYHCLVRTVGQAFIHEEPFMEINLEKIKPFSAHGAALKKFSPRSANIHFFDGTSYYYYSRAKNTLYKRFEIEKGYNSKLINIDIAEDALGKLYEKFLNKKLSNLDNVFMDDESLSVPGVDYVVLPLYSVLKGMKYVPEKSGLNQWNAAGRPRKFGESYIPVPKKVHLIAPNFFPLNKSFQMNLPNSTKTVLASLCQSENKALMSNPNDELCKWIFRVIDEKFKESDFDKPPKRKPFTYEDLEVSGYDCVRVTKSLETGFNVFNIVFEPIGGYEDFLEQSMNGI